jgi:type IV pilus assembly protein PilW
MIELLIAMALAGVFLTALIELFVGSVSNSRTIDELSRLQEGGRNAIQLLASDIRRSGYLGGNIGVSEITGSLGTAAAGATPTCPMDNTWGRMIDEPIAGLNDTNTGYACLSSAGYLRGDVLTVRYTPSWSIAEGDMIVTGLYLRTSVVEGRIFAGADQNNSSNIILDDNTENFSLMAHNYYVGSSGRSCQGQAIPALFRTTLSAAGLPFNQEVLPGVEHLQFRYQEGSQYRDANNVTDWLDVNAVEISVLMRADCPDTNFVNNRTFSMGDLDPAYGPSDALRRQLFTTVVTIRRP